MRRTLPSILLLAPAGLCVWLGCGLKEGAGTGHTPGSLTDPAALICPHDRSSVVVLDRGSDSLVDADRATGALTLLSGNLVGVGPALQRPLLMAQNGDENSVLVLSKDDDSNDVVVEIDLDSGDRSTRIELAPNDDLALASTANDLVLTEDGTQLVLADEQSGLIAIDLDSGERSQIGTIPGVAKGLATSGPHDVWVAVVGTSSFVEVELEDGATLQDVPPQPGSPKDLVLVDESHALALFSGGPSSDDALSHGLRSVDLSSGEQAQISGGEQGDGPDFSLPSAFCVDQESQEAFVLDSQARAIFKVDLQSGERSIITRW